MKEDIIFLVNYSILLVCPGCLTVHIWCNLRNKKYKLQNIFVGVIISSVYLHLYLLFTRQHISPTEVKIEPQTVLGIIMVSVVAPYVFHFILMKIPENNIIFEKMDIFNSLYDGVLNDYFKIGRKLAEITIYMKSKDCKYEGYYIARDDEWISLHIERKFKFEDGKYVEEKDFATNDDRVLIVKFGEIEKIEAKEIHMSENMPKKRKKRIKKKKKINYINLL